jgi:Uma2 family endonuclease
VATQAALTLDEFLALPESEDGSHYELSEGELITLPPSGYRHGVVLVNVATIPRASLDRLKFIVTCGGAGFLSKSDLRSATVRGADVAVNLRESLGKIHETGYLAQAPNLAAEVNCPGNTAPDMVRKVSEHLSAGSSEVWLLYPETHHLHVYYPNGDAKIFRANDRFQSVLGPEFQVAAFFEN